MFQKTGMVFHGDLKSSKQTADFWSEKIFSTKTDGVKINSHLKHLFLVQDITTH